MTASNTLRRLVTLACALLVIYGTLAFQSSSPHRWGGSCRVASQYLSQGQGWSHSLAKKMDTSFARERSRYVSMMSDYDTLRGMSSRKVSDVTIETPTLNSRRITASIIIDTPIEDVWSIITDYDNLSVHVPNLIQSYVVPTPGKKVRLFQEGAQKIVGFDFRASLTMDMTEVDIDASRAMKERTLKFKLVDSQMFDSFDGSWSMNYYSRNKQVDPVTKEVSYSYKTQLTYSVLVRPKGIVPVIALEWRIREDVPTNLLAMKVASEKLMRESGRGPPNGPSRGKSGRSGSAADVSWLSDETLVNYLPKKQPVQTSTVSMDSRVTAGARASSPPGIDAIATVMSASNSGNVAGSEISGSVGSDDVALPVNSAMAAVTRGVLRGRSTEAAAIAAEERVPYPEQESYEVVPGRSGAVGGVRYVSGESSASAYGPNASWVGLSGTSGGGLMVEQADEAQMQAAQSLEGASDGNADFETVIMAISDAFQAAANRMRRPQR